MRTNWSWNCRLSVLEAIKMMPVKPSMTNFKMTVRGECAISACSPLPLSINALAHWLSVEGSWPLDSCPPSPPQPQSLAFKIKQTSFLPTWPLNWLLSGKQPDPTFGYRLTSDSQLFWSPLESWGCTITIWLSNPVQTSTCRKRGDSAMHLPGVDGIRNTCQKSSARMIDMLRKGQTWVDGTVFSVVIGFAFSLIVMLHTLCLSVINVFFFWASSLSISHSSNLAWRIPWTEEPGRLQSMGLQRVRHDWVTITHSLTVLQKLFISS